MAEHIPFVLLVEEDPTLAEVTAFRLELLGYRVRTAANSDNILQAIKAEKPDVIVVDLERSGNQGGLALIEALSRDEETTTIPIMAMSADAELDSVQRAFRAGATEYLVTPYNPLVLEAKVEQLAELSGKSL
jgi:CheY-like chemotaxis protein